MNHNQYIRRILTAGVLLFFMAAPCFSQEKIYTVAGTSMSPTLNPGDQIVVNHQTGQPVARKDMVAVCLKNRANPMVKRVIAVAKDWLAIKQGVLWVNDKPLDPVVKIDANKWKSTIRQLEHYHWVLPAGTVFILGDNLGNSRDSSRLGIISQSQICGRVVNILKAGSANLK